jgi:hypothetical protein
MDCIGYGAHDEKGLLVPIKFKRRFPLGTFWALSLLMLASSCLVQLGCCVKDFPCL